MAARGGGAAILLTILTCYLHNAAFASDANQQGNQLIPELSRRLFKIGLGSAGESEIRPKVDCVSRIFGQRYLMTTP